MFKMIYHQFANNCLKLETEENFPKCQVAAEQELCPCLQQKVTRRFHNVPQVNQKTMQTPINIIINQ